jgi:hypothetical protein
VLVAGIIPLALVGLARGARAARARSRRDAAYELALAGGALAAAGAARWILRAVTSAGGFTVRPLSTRVAPPGEILAHNLPAAGRCLLVLFGASTAGPPAGQPAFFLRLHLAGVALAAAGVAVAAWRIRRGGNLVSHVLLAAIAVNLAAFLVTERAVDAASAREIAPVLPFAAALAARELSPALGRARWSPGRLLAVVGIGYVAGLGLELTAPAAPPQGAPLTAWLADHRLGGCGLGGYWQASVVTLTSGGTVAIRPVADVGGAIRAHPGEVSDAWFDPRRSCARFVVLSPGEPGYPGYADYQAVRATWGAPARVYHVGEYTVWSWPKNLLSTISH